MHSKNFIRLTTWMLINPHRFQTHSKSTPEDCLPLLSDFPVALSLQPDQKSPQILEASWHCWLLGNSCKTDKILLAFCKLNLFSFQNGNSSLHIHKVLTLVISATKAHFTSGLSCICCKPIFFIHKKIPSSHYTQVVLHIQVWSKLFFLICLCTTMKLRSLFEH